MIITKRIKDKKEYFYLRHNIRKGDKIITKEKYLGNKIPKNIDNIKEEFYRELNKELFVKFDIIKDEFQKNWKKIPKYIQEDELREIAIAFTYNTNAIEGSTITKYETREIIQFKQAPNKQLDDIEETKKHAEVFLEAIAETGDRRLGTGEKIKNVLISNKLILDWHRKMFLNTKEEIAGVFRNYLVRVGNYIAPDSKEVITLMNNLFKFIKNSKFHPIETAARAHYIFEMIHPFGDGNGRVGRLLMNYILWNNGYPILIIEYKTRKAYYKALEKNEQGFVQYFFKYYLRVHS